MIHHLGREGRSGMTRMVAAAAMMVLLAGCSSYQLPVRVIESSVAGAMIVPDSEAERTRDGVGVSSASIRLIRDPGTLREETAGRTRTNGRGDAILDLDAFGAGWMEESWRVVVVAPGRETVTEILRLPRSADGRVLLVEMPQGRSMDPAPESLDEVLERYR